MKMTAVVTQEFWLSGHFFRQVSFVFRRSEVYDKLLCEDHRRMDLVTLKHNVTLSGQIHEP